MELSDRHLLDIFFQSDDELKALLEKPLDQIISNKIYYRALERLLGIIAITIGRLNRLHPQWQIPHLRTILKLKTQVVWDFSPLRQQFIEHIIGRVLPEIRKFLSEKNYNLQNNEN